MNKANPRNVLAAGSDDSRKALVVLSCQMPGAKRKNRKPRSERRARRNGKSKGTKLASYATYAEYLASPEWKEIKSRWRASALCRGEICHSAGCRNSFPLQLHHRTYARIGYEQLSDLVLVCDDCHTKIHALRNAGLPLRDATVKIVGY